MSELVILEDTPSRPGYRPEADGALCAECLLRTCRQGDPVPSEINDCAEGAIAILAEAPGETEVREGRPLVGASGMELRKHLLELGIRRQDVNWVNVLACRPPANKLEGILAKVRAARRREADDGVPREEWTKTPMECCAPRLAADLAQSANIIALGAVAARAMIPGLDRRRKDETSAAGGILAIRGNLFPRLDGRKILPTVHPAFVLRSQRYRHVFAADLARAFRWFRGGSGWREPTITLLTGDPSDEAKLEAFFDRAKAAPFVTFDTETDAKEALRASLRCIGFGTANDGVVVHFRSLLGESFRDTSNDARLRSMIRDFLTGPARKVGHNARVYDRVVIECNLGVTPVNVTDTLALHLLADPEVPHGLGFLGSFYTDVPAWKHNHTATEAQTDEELGKYCALDCVVNHRIVGPVAKAVKQHGQETILPWLHAMQDVCVDMSRRGMLVDQAARQRHEARLTAEARRWYGLCVDTLALEKVREARFYGIAVEESEAAELDKAAGIAVPKGTLNPNSPAQVADVLFRQWDLPLPNDVKEEDLYTESGGRSTSDIVLRAYLGDKRVPKPQRDWIQAVRMYRKQIKLLGTYIRPLVPGGTALYPDGRIHPSWNILTSVGRLNSQGPNAQNIPEELKDLFIPAEGMAYVGADMDALHLRIIANLWRVAGLRRCFDEGLDPHGVFAEAIFGDVYRQAVGYQGYGKKPAKGAAGDLRALAKRLRFAGAYSAGVPTIYRVLLSAENDDGTLVNPNLRMKQVYAMYDAWMETEPEWRQAWDRTLSDWQEAGELRSALLGRRRPFLDETPTDVINFPILGFEGDLMTTTTVDLSRRLAAGGFSPQGGIVNQCHDAITLEVPTERAEECRVLLQETMTRRIAGHPVPYTATAKIGRHWGEV